MIKMCNFGIQDLREKKIFFVEIWDIVTEICLLEEHKTNIITEDM